ncbi:helix-turn-helix domain-containing protein [Pseudomonas aeruginosa]|nr:helix-turn-helix domain-containing protein [Pseudomonas aeruginosa]EMD2213629.1 helix-turn-helix domain-containing protein [Pseudomonas aeruginosa]EMD2215386.1 helix-turn-helix domain-containing protein [Pseudomonas aeruginosa]MUL50627.1 helix-turn-helix domain-containing protein [Pseudomonas aeruginosa]HCF6394690.1 helix-turn-helix domain-containing protein [Pseudomonas aeruginosa]
MPAHALLETRRASTQDIPLEQRLAFWEDYNASILVGLKCSSYSQAGFAATQDNLCLERLRLARIGGNEHVVERDRSMIRAVPKESIFVSLVQGSQSFFYQDNGCNLLQPGELVIYRTDKPYLFGFSGPMRQFIFDIPQDDFAERCLRDFKGPLKIGAESPVQRLLVRTLGERTRDFLDSPHGEDAERYQEEAYDLLASIISDHAGEHRASALGASYLLAAKQYIQQHLDEPALSCERVAAATGVSSRHLARLFAQEGSSPGRYLQERRLERARQLLVSPQGRRLDVAEVAYRHGFSSQAHFARAFKARYGMTPSEARGR